jgi:hypothetical protein
VCAIGRWHNLTLIAWHAQATGSAVARVARFTRTVCEEFPGGFSNIHLIHSSAPLPTAEARAGFVEMMNRHRDTLRNVAIVLAGSGFRASTMRSAITAMRFLAPRSFEMRIHREASEILPWLPAAHARATGVELPRASLHRLLTEAEQTNASAVPANNQDSLRPGQSLDVTATATQRPEEPKR